jgi:hypothetical protein
MQPLNRARRPRGPLRFVSLYAILASSPGFADVVCTWNGPVVSLIAQFLNLNEIVWTAHPGKLRVERRDVM